MKLSSYPSLPSKVVSPLISILFGSEHKQSRICIILMLVFLITHPGLAQDTKPKPGDKKPHTQKARENTKKQKSSSHKKKPPKNSATQKSSKTASNSKQVPKTVAPENQNQYFVSPTGTLTGDGSIDNPWSLEKALSTSSNVQPGSIIWLRGGTYSVPSTTLGFISSISGTSANPIKIVSYPGEWAVIDGNLSGSPVKNKTIIEIKGNYTWFMNFEVTNTDPARVIPIEGSNPPERRGSAIYDYGRSNKLINLVIHDAGQGIGAWSSGFDGEYYGNVIYNNGWDAPDRLHGHGSYIQNTIGFKLFKNNVYFNPFANIIQVYGSQLAKTNDIKLIKNKYFNGRFLIASGSEQRGFLFDSNKIFGSRLEVGWGGLSSSYKTAAVVNNYIVGTATLHDYSESFVFRNNTVTDSTYNTVGRILTIKTDTDLSRFDIDNNTYYRYSESYPYWSFSISGSSTLAGVYAWDDQTGTQAKSYNYAGTKGAWHSSTSGTKPSLDLEPNSTFIDNLPQTNVVFVEPNEYDATKATVTIYNWENSNTVAITPPAGMLQNGDNYKLINVQDYFNDVINGVYQGGTISVPMTGRSRAKPIGYDQSNWYHDPLQPNTFPRFGVFILQKLSSQNPPATATVTGKVVGSSGTTSITMYGQNYNQTVRNGFGYFRFTNVPTGATYTISVDSRRCHFSEAVTVNADSDTTLNC